jgi:signal transduction histidine kinase
MADSHKTSNRRRLDFNSLRFRLTTALVLFAIIIMSFFWVLQTGFSGNYYERVMEKRGKATMEAVTAQYSSSETLDPDELAQKLMELSQDTDMFVYIEAIDGSCTISSETRMPYGRFAVNGARIVDKARAMLLIGEQDSVSYYVESGGEKTILVNASKVSSPYRCEAYVYVITPITPLGPAAEIMSSQLLIVTIFSIILAGIIALLYTRILVKPVTELNAKAKQLSAGNYDIDFDVQGYTEIEDLSHTLTQAADDLSKSDQLQRDLLANVSHDLRTPLTMIKSYAELIRDISGDNKDRRDEHLQVIVDETDRLSELVGDIPTLSKLQSGTEKMDLKDVDIQKAAESVLGIYKVLEESDGFRFNFKDLPGEVMVRADEHRIKQVIANLISNAVRYSGDGRDVDIVFSKEDGRVRCEVRDHGIGIAKEDLDNIWNRYEKASRQGTRSHSGGTGLGLSIAREILEKHDAVYGVESALGKGSCFWFSLPVE